MSDTMPLLNVYEVETEAGPSAFLCFVDPVLAAANGIDPRSILGLYKVDEREDFDIDGFAVNPAFVAAFADYMNEEAAISGAIIAQARDLADGPLYILDPREPGIEGTEPAEADVLGAFDVDESGQIIPGSFEYNEGHTFFDRARGPSGVLQDRQFYNWLHGIEPGSSDAPA
jgi:hypothetical protein